MLALTVPGALVVLVTLAALAWWASGWPTPPLLQPEYKARQ